MRTRFLPRLRRRPHHRIHEPLDDLQRRNDDGAADNGRDDFFPTDRRWIAWLVRAGALIAVALIAAETRSVWLATAVGGAYLIWFWKRWALIAIPVLAAIVLLTNPFELGDRVISAFKPHGDIDSNAHRAMCRAIGYQMIKAHPLLGMGPEQVGSRS